MVMHHWWRPLPTGGALQSPLHSPPAAWSWRHIYIQVSAVRFSFMSAPHVAVSRSPGHTSSLSSRWVLLQVWLKLRHPWVAPLELHPRQPCWAWVWIWADRGTREPFRGAELWFRRTCSPPLFTLHPQQEEVEEEEEEEEEEEVGGPGPRWGCPHWWLRPEGPAGEAAWLDSGEMLWGFC